MSKLTNGGILGRKLDLNSQENYLLTEETTGIRYVGGNSLAIPGTTGNTTFMLTPLQDGTDLRPYTDDIVILSYSIAGDYSVNPPAFTVSGTVAGDSWGTATLGLTPAPDSSLVYVGGTTASLTSSNVTTTEISLQSLTGGVGSAPLSNDLVLISYGIGSTGNSSEQFGIAPFGSNGTSVDDAWAAASLVLPPLPGQSVVYVGGNSFPVANSVGNVTMIPLTSLTGGIASEPANNDVIVVNYAVSSTESCTVPFTSTDFVNFRSNANATTDATCAITFALRPDSSLTYVGGKTNTLTVFTSYAANVSLTDLQGGIASYPNSNDLVLVSYSVGSTAVLSNQFSPPVATVVWSYSAINPMGFKYQVPFLPKTGELIHLVGSNSATNITTSRVVNLPPETAAGDIVMVNYTLVRSSAVQDFTVTISGYTNLHHNAFNGDTSLSFDVLTKTMGDTPDTSVTIPAIPGGDLAMVTVMVFRGVSSINTSNASTGRSSQNTVFTFPATMPKNSVMYLVATQGTTGKIPAEFQDPVTIAGDNGVTRGAQLISALYRTENVLIYEYSKLANLVSDDSYDSSLAVFYTTTPNTYVNIPVPQSNADPGAIAIQVWRGINTSNIFSANLTVSTSPNTRRPTLPSVSTYPLANGSPIILVGSAGHRGGVSETFIPHESYSNNFLTVTADSTNNSTIGMGYLFADNHLNLGYQRPALSLTTDGVSSATNSDVTQGLYYRTVQSYSNSLAVPNTGSNLVAGAVTVQVFRNANAVLIATSNAAALDSRRPNPPNINPASRGSAVVITGAAAHVTGGIRESFTPPSGFSNNFTGISSNSGPRCITVGSDHLLSNNFLATSYTRLGTVNGPGTFFGNLGMFYKLMDSSPDSSVIVPSTGALANSGAVAIQVWRNTDIRNPIESSGITLSSSSGSAPNPGALSLSSNGAAIVIAGSLGLGRTTVPLVAPTGYTTNFLTVNSSAVANCTVGMGYRTQYLDYSTDVGPFTYAVAPAGYTQLARISNGDFAASVALNISYKKMGSIPDSSVTITQTGSTLWAGAVAAQVWRNLDLVNPIDVVSTTSYQNTIRPTPPSITPVSTGSIIVATGASGHGSGALSYGANNFGVSGSAVTDSWSATSMVLRPATDQTLTYVGGMTQEILSSSDNVSNISISNLVGGISSNVSQNDLMLLSYGIGSTTNRTYQFEPYFYPVPESLPLGGGAAAFTFSLPPLANSRVSFIGGNAYRVDNATISYTSVAVPAGTNTGDLIITGTGFVQADTTPYNSLHIGVLPYYHSNLTSTLGSRMGGITLALKPGIDNTISYVGGVSSSITGSVSSNTIVNLPIGTSANDLVLVGYSIGSHSDRRSQLSPNGYTEAATVYSSSGTPRFNYRISYKFMGNVPDSNVVIPPTGDAGDAGATTIQVWRGVNQSNPFEYTPDTTLIDGQVGIAQSPAVRGNNVSSDSVIVIGASSSQGALYPLIAPGGFFTEYLANVGDSTRDTSIGMGYMPVISDVVVRYNNTGVISSATGSFTNFAAFYTIVGNTVPNTIIVPNVGTSGIGNRVGVGFIQVFRNVDNTLISYQTSRVGTIGPNPPNSKLYSDGSVLSIGGILGSSNSALSALRPSSETWKNLVTFANTNPVAVKTASIGAAYADSNTDITINWSNVASIVAQDTYVNSLGIFYKFMDSSIDIYPTIPPTGNIGSAGAVTVQVWRNVDRNNPFDVANTTAGATGARRPIPPAITPATVGSVEIVVGSAAHDNGSAELLTAPAGYSKNFLSITSDKTVDVSLATGYNSFSYVPRNAWNYSKVPYVTVGFDDAYDTTLGMFAEYWQGDSLTPARFSTFQTTDSNSASAAGVSMALKPALITVGEASNKTYSGTWNTDAKFLSRAEEIEIARIVGYSTAASVTASSNLNIAIPQTVRRNDLILVAAASNSIVDLVQFNNTNFKPSGYNLIQYSNGNSAVTTHCAAFYKVSSDGSESGSTLTIPTQNSAHLSAAIAVIRGALDSSPIGNIGTISKANTTTVNTFSGIPISRVHSIVFSIMSVDRAVPVTLTSNLSTWVNRNSISTDFGTYPTMIAWSQNNFLGLSFGQGDSTEPLTITTSALSSTNGFQVEVKSTY